MVPSLKSLALVALLAAVAPAVVLAAEECDNLNEMANYWDQIAVDLEKAAVGISGLTNAEAERIDAAIGEVLPVTEELAEWLDSEEALKSTGLGAQLYGDMQAFIDAEDIDSTLGTMDDIAVTIGEVVDLCDEGWAVAGGGPSGTVIVTFYSPEGYGELAQALYDSGVFQAVANSVNSTLRLPVDLPVEFTACGTPNAYYDPSARKVTMCYELLTLSGELIATETSTDEEIGQAILGTGTFFMLHEVGHALVHLLEIPITGREEDSVDNLATLILLTGDENDEAAIFSTIQNFGALSLHMESGNDNLPFWDEHSLNSQRLYDVACLVFGSDPQTYAGMVGPDRLPEERAVRCPGEYEQKDQAWGVLLQPHMHDG